MNRHSALILHAHVPWVRHGGTPRCLEEDWLFEAILETYLPLLDVLHRLRDDGVAYRLTLNLTPTLLGMLNDDLMKDRASAYIERTAKLAAGEAESNSDPSYRQMATWYVDRLNLLRDLWEKRWDRDLIPAFKDLSDSGHVEITASGATHGLLPLLMKVPEAARAQIQSGADEFERHFGSRAAGFWLPECAYAPALSPFLREAGIRWTVLEEHSFTAGRASEGTSPCHPVETANGLAVFARDIDSSKQVWSAESGYPGDGRYREFFKDVGLEGPMESLAEYLDGSEIRRFTGLKFYRVTGKTDDKLLYDPALAGRAAAEHAVHFVESRAAQLAELESRGKEDPIVVSAFDAELFGHWWFEGPTFLDGVIRCLDRTPVIRAVTLGDHLERYGISGDVSPAPSSWGERGYNDAWLRSDTGWVYLHLHRAAGELQELAQGYEQMLDVGRALRLLRQAARSLLLAQSSDWTFLMGRGAGSAYAESRLREQLSRVRFLIGALRGDGIAEEHLVALETMDNLFPNLDPSHLG